MTLQDQIMSALKQAMKDKDVVLYLLNDEKGVLDDAKFSCSSYWGTSRTPEICEYQWCTLDEMAAMVFPSQRGLVEFLRTVDL